MIDYDLVRDKNHVYVPKSNVDYEIEKALPDEFELYTLEGANPNTSNNWMSVGQPMAQTTTTII